MEASDAKKLRDLEAESARLKRIVADQMLDMTAVLNILDDHGRFCPGQIVDLSISGARVTAVSR